MSNNQNSRYGSLTHYNTCKLHKDKKLCIALDGKPIQSDEASTATWDHRILHATQHR